MFKKYITDPLFQHTAKVDSIAQKNKNTTNEYLQDKKDSNYGRKAESYGDAIAQSYNEERARAKNEAGKVRNAEAIHNIIAKIHSTNQLREHSGLPTMPFNGKDIQHLLKDPSDSHMRARQMGPFPLKTNAELQNYLKARKAYLRTSSQNRRAISAPYQEGSDGSSYTTIQGFGAPTLYSDTRTLKNYYNTDMNSYAENNGNIPNDMDESTVIYPGLANSHTNPFTQPKIKVPDAYLRNWNFSLDLNEPDTEISYTPQSLQTQIPSDTWYEKDKRQNLTQPTYEPK